MVIKIKKFSVNAKTPTQATKGSAGYDLYAAQAVVIPPLKRALIPTNIAISIPEGFYGRIAPRSGLALKRGIEILGGVIDSDYRSDVGVILYNTDDKEFSVNLGDRIAQIIIERRYDTQFLEVNELDSTERNAGGFGSTGT